MFDNKKSTFLDVNQEQTDTILLKNAIDFEAVILMSGDKAILLLAVEDYIIDKDLVARTALATSHRYINFTTETKEFNLVFCPKDLAKTRMLKGYYGNSINFLLISRSLMSLIRHKINKGDDIESILNAEEDISFSGNHSIAYTDLDSSPWMMWDLMKVLNPFMDVPGIYCAKCKR